jgi:hypothetical protein
VTPNPKAAKKSATVARAPLREPVVLQPPFASARAWSRGASPVWMQLLS